MNDLTCGYCGVQIYKPRRLFCSHACAVSNRKGTKQRRGPNTGRSKDKVRIRDIQRRSRGWTEEQIQAGIAVQGDRFAPARKLGFRSMFEHSVYTDITSHGYTAEYEPFKMSYQIEGRYVPDFVLPNGVIVEAKGFLDAVARAKMRAVKASNPNADIRFVFMDSSKTLGKGSKTTYADWARKYGFLWADKVIPIKWLQERPKEFKKND